MADIAQTLLGLAAEDAVCRELPDIRQDVKSLMTAIEAQEPSGAEHALMNLYIKLHSAGSKYSPAEREVLDRKKGYPCLPGGLSPIVMAEQFIHKESVVADLGAGNGLQGLLLQRIYPHKKTLQIELSSEMLRIGRIFQQALGISRDSIEWINDDISNVSIEDADFIYLYRPSKPTEDEKGTYQCIADKLSLVRKPLIVFSVADCLYKYLDKRFSIFYSDGHLTCFSKE